MIMTDEPSESNRKSAAESMSSDDPQNLTERGRICQREQEDATTPPGNGRDSDPMLDCEAQLSQSNEGTGQAGGDHLPGAVHIRDAGQAEVGEKWTQTLPRYKDQVVGREAPREQAAPRNANPLVFKHQVYTVLPESQQGTDANEESAAKAGPEFKDQVRPAVNENAPKPPPEPEPEQEQEQPQESSADSPVVAFLVDSTIVQGDRVVVESNDGAQAREMEANNLRRQRRKKAIWIVALVVVVTTAIVAGSVCGTGVCSWSNSDEPPLPTLDPTAPPTLDPEELERRLAIANYINNITFSEYELVYPVSIWSAATPEELALQWLLEDDPLQLTMETPPELFRLTQRYALSSLWFQSNQNWTKSENWLGSNECNWYGIQCEEVDSQFVVSSIDFDTGNNIKGQFPPDLCLLTHITYLDMSSNELYGTLPACSGIWTGLTEFKINNNELTGTLPESMGLWNNLLGFEANNNELTGMLPESLGNWKNLQLFAIQHNLFSSTLPTALGQWSSLLLFYANSNQLGGTIPESLGDWTSIRTFDVNFNRLASTLPETVGKWHNLAYFDIAGNYFTGTMPPSIGNWSNLEYFVADKEPETFGGRDTNDLSGTLPDSIGQWSNLKHFFLYNNSLTGSLPTSIGQWTKLEMFDIGLNHEMNGTLPVSIQQWTNIWYVVVYKRISSNCNSDNHPITHILSITLGILRFMKRT